MFKPETRILVVDDVEMMRDLVVRMLTELGFTSVEVAVDGEQAWEKISKVAQTEKAYELVISDVVMPRLSGLDLLKKVREDGRCRDIPFVVLSADIETGHVMDAIKSGVNQYILKPFNSVTLADKLRATHEAIARVAASAPTPASAE